MGLRGRAWVAQINSLHQRFALTPKTRLRRQFLCFRIVQLRYSIYLLSRPPIQQSVTYSFYDFLFPGARFSMGCAKIRPSAWFSRDGLDLDLTDRLEAAEHLYNSLCPFPAPASIVSFLLFRRRSLDSAFLPAFLGLLMVFGIIEIGAEVLALAVPLATGTSKRRAAKHEGAAYLKTGSNTGE